MDVDAEWDVIEIRSRVGELFLQQESTERVLAQISALFQKHPAGNATRLSATRPLFVVVDLRGGWSTGAWRIFDALRQFSEFKPVVTFVEHAYSAAPWIALAGDLVIMWDPGPPEFDAAGSLVHDPPGFLLHAAVDLPERTPAEMESIRRDSMRMNLDRLAPRVATPRETLVEWLSVTDTDVQARGALLPPGVAVGNGWADATAATREEAEEHARRWIQAGAPRTKRTAMMRGTVPRSAFPCPPALRYTGTKTSREEIFT